jgi:hypothetical protein
MFEVMNGFNYQKYLIFAAIQKRSCGRVARQSSAKARTAVRIRSGPQQVKDYGDVILFCLLALYQQTLKGEDAPY